LLSNGVSGYEVTVFTSAAPSNIRDEWIEGVHIRRFRRLNEWWFMPWYITPGMILPAFTNDFDIIHAFGYIYFQNLLASCVKRILGVPLVVTAALHHGRGLYARTIARKATKAADCVIAQCESERAKLSRYVPRAKITEIPCGIKRERFGLLPDRKAFKRSSGVKEKDRAILFVGSLSREEGLNDLIRAMGQVREKVREAKLLIIGGGNSDAY
jgi:glycosyltransferase involved in cell wall biosynthesis